MQHPKEHGKPGRGGGKLRPTFTPLSYFLSPKKPNHSQSEMCISSVLCNKKENGNVTIVSTVWIFTGLVFFLSRGRRLGRPLSDASCITQAILVLYVVLEGSPGGGFLLGGRLDITSFFFLPLCESSLEHFAAGEDGFFPLIFLVVLSGPFISPRFVPLLSIMMEGGAFIERAANDSISKAKQGPL